MSTRLQRTADKSQNEKNAAILRDLLKKDDNRYCADCKKHDARWSSWNIGCFVCIRCSGIHRSMGTHISRVKSIDLDTWTAEQIANVQKWGNKRANKYWEANLKADHKPSDHKIESFIRTKYEMKRWAMQGPIPDPATLGDDPAPVEQAKPAAAAAASSSAQVKKDPFNLLDGPPAQSSKTAPAPAQASNGGGLFDLDFNAAPTANVSTASNTTSATSRNMKDSILSLYGSAPPVRQQVVSPTQPPSQQQAFGGFQSAGQPPLQQQQQAFAGVQAFGAAPPQQQAFAGMQSFGAPPPQPQHPAAQPTSQQGLFNSQDIWGGSGQTSAPAPAQSGADIWGDFSSSSAPSQPKQKDAFSDIGGWGSFK